MTAPASQQLGQSEDPTELVPGSVGAVESMGRDFSSEATRIGGLYDMFRAIRVEGWTGATYAVYDARFDDECAKWTSYVKLLTTAGETLTTYAGKLSAAQADAQRAIERWRAGTEATQRAVTAYNQHVADYNAYVASPDTASRCVAHPGAFSDPGKAARDEAEQILEDARKALEKAGHAALVALGMLEGARTDGQMRGPGAEGSASGPKFSWDAWDEAFGKDPAKGPDGAYDDQHADGPFKLTLGNVKGAAWVLNGKGSVEDYLWGGNVKVNADGSYTVMGAKGSAEATIDKEGLRLNADGTLTVVGVEGRAGGQWGYLEVGGEAKGSVEATAKGHLNGGKDGLHAGGEVFAGARGSVEGKADLGGVGGTASVEGWAGVGAAADADLGYEDGKLTVGGAGGLAWGLGGKVKAEVTLDFPKIWDTGADMVDGVRAWLD